MKDQKQNEPETETELPPEVHIGKKDGVKISARGIFGKWLKVLYEATFILTILIFGTFLGTLLACLLPLGFPLLILYKRYVQNQGKPASE